MLSRGKDFAKAFQNFFTTHKIFITTTLLFDFVLKLVIKKSAIGLST